MLKDYVATKRKVEFDGGNFEVRGISLPDVAAAVLNHREAVDRIATVIRLQDQLSMDDLGAVLEIVIDVIKESPYLAADLICSCAEEPEEFSTAFKLPLSVQVEALRAIGELTFTDANALKKLIADVSTLLSGILPSPTAAAA